jgi:hypothetical protein
MGQQKFDGWDVELFEGKFTGGFDVDREVAAQILYGDEVTFLVTASAKGVGFKDNADGDMKRTNAFTVNEALVLDDEKLVKTVRDAVINGAVQSVGGQMPGQLAIDTVVEEEEDVFVPDSRPQEVIPQNALPASDDAILRNFLDGPA